MGVYAFLSLLPLTVLFPYKLNPLWIESLQKGQNTMKNKKVIIAIGITVVLVLASIVAVSAGNGKKPYLDSEGKLVGGELQPAADGAGTQSREERLGILREEKENFDKNVNPSAENETGALSPEELSVFAEMEALADKEIENALKVFSDGLKILNKYGETEYNEKVTEREYITRDILAEMVNVIERGRLSGDEALTLKKCIAERFVIVSPEDPLYGRIKKIFNN